MSTYYLQGGEVDIFASLSYWNTAADGSGSAPTAWFAADVADINGQTSAYLLTAPPVAGILIADSIGTGRLSVNFVAPPNPDAVLESAGGNYHAPAQSEVLDTAVYGPNSATPGTFDIGLYVLITNVVAPAYVAVGHDNYVGGEAGTFVGAGVTLDGIATAVWTMAGAIDGKTPQQALRYIAAVVAGKRSGAGTSTQRFLGLDGVTERVAGTRDANGNRVTINYDGE